MDLYSPDLTVYDKAYNAGMQRQKSQIEMQELKDKQQLNSSLDEAVANQFRRAPQTDAQVDITANQRVIAPEAPTQETAMPSAPSGGIAAQSIPVEQQQQSPASQPTQQTAKTTPFDSPDFLQNIAQQLSGQPGSGRMLMEMKTQRDKMVGNILEMYANGNTTEADYLSQRNGFQIPEQIKGDANIARGMSLASKSYPDEEDKAQRFFQAYMENSNAPIRERIISAMNVAGEPTPSGKIALRNSIALAEEKARLEAQKPNLIYGEGNQAYYVNPSTGAATTVRNEEGQALTGVQQAGKTNKIRDQYMNVGGNLVDLSQRDEQGNPKVVMQGPSGEMDLRAKALNAATEVSSGPEEVDANFKKYYNMLKGEQQIASPPIPQSSGATQQTALPARESRMVNQTYDTPIGPMKWTGTGWVKP